jgi:hypothetical protein
MNNGASFVPKYLLRSLRNEEIESVDCFVLASLIDAIKMLFDVKIDVQDEKSNFLFLKFNEMVEFV